MNEIKQELGFNYLLWKFPIILMPVLVFRRGRGKGKKRPWLMSYHFRISIITYNNQRYDIYVVIKKIYFGICLFNDKSD